MKTTIKPITEQQYKKMNKKRRIVYLAKDVLAQLKAKTLTAQNGGYLHGRDKIGNIITRFSSASVKAYLARLDTCFVCAKGALVASYAKNVCSNVACNKVLWDVSYHKEMTNVFGCKIWNEIEAAYEGYQGYKQHTMEELMQNLIDNKGVFNTSVLRTR